MLPQHSAPSQHFQQLFLIYTSQGSAVAVLLYWMHKVTATSATDVSVVTMGHDSYWIVETASKG